MIFSICLAALSAAARPWPDLGAQIVVFADPLPNFPTWTQHWFASTKFARASRRRVRIAYEIFSHGQRNISGRSLALLMSWLMFSMNTAVLFCARVTKAWLGMKYSSAQSAIITPMKMP